MSGSKTITSRKDVISALDSTAQDDYVWDGVSEDDRPLSADEMRAGMKKRGRPKQAVTKQAVTIRLSPDVVEHFKHGGKGWQTRLDNVLKDYVERQNERA